MQYCKMITNKLLEKVDGFFKEWAQLKASVFSYFMQFWQLINHLALHSPLISQTDSYGWILIPSVGDSLMNVFSCCTI